ncbi:MAG: hypothetical protein IKK59_04345 [Lachnospiraceae bacterium]|nr:hypothetical protein [Lachnospiraceae bacterium]
MGKRIWDEEPAVADDYRARYAEGIAEYIKKMNTECKALRRTYMSPEELVKNQEFYREKYKEMLGLKFFSEKVSKPVEMTYVGSDEICKIYRLSVYITDEIPFYAMLLVPHGVKAPMPLVIAQHGGGGTPELCSDMNGQNNYNHMVQRAMARGAAILAPQLMLWSMTEIATMRAHAVPHNRQKVDVDMKRFGSSITALEISGIMKSLDYVCGMEEIDADRVAMIGLSYGGYFTLHTMAADTRIKAGYCAGVFNDRDVYDWADWSYKGSALSFQDAEVAALCAPRKLYVQVGMEDQVFDYHSAITEAERVGDYFKAFGKADHFQFNVWEGGHTIGDDDKGYDFLFSELA